MLRFQNENCWLHSHVEGCTQAISNFGATWVARSHRIEYFQPAFVREQIAVLTWISNWRRARTLRKYKFLRLAEGSILAEGETDWVYVDAKTGRPRSIPESICDLFELLPPNEEVRGLETFVGEHIAVM